MNSVALGTAISLLVTASGLLAYDRLVAKPSMAIGVVDVAEVGEGGTVGDRADAVRDRHTFELR